MEIMLGNALQAVSDKIQEQFKTAKRPTILGFRFWEGPWENTYFIEVQSKDEVYSTMLIKENGCLKCVAPFKVDKKVVIKK